MARVRRTMSKLFWRMIGLRANGNGELLCCKAEDTQGDLWTQSPKRIVMKLGSYRSDESHRGKIGPACSPGQAIAYLCEPNAVRGVQAPERFYKDNIDRDRDDYGGNYPGEAVDGSRHKERRPSHQEASGEETDRRADGKAEF